VPVGEQTMSGFVCGIDTGRIFTDCVVLDPDGLTEYLDLLERDGSVLFACARCGRLLCPPSENYKAHAHRIERPIQAANPLIGDLKRFIDAEVLFHQFCCLACSGLIENDVCRAGYPLL